MMTKLVEKISYYLDIGARWMVAAIMFVSTLNVILRLLGVSFKGAVEIVQYLNGLGIGLAIAHCAVLGGHVAITFFTDKLSPKAQIYLSIFVDLIIVIFLGLTALELFKSGTGMMQSGEIALTTGLPIFPIVYAIAVGFVAHLLVVLIGLAKTLQKIFITKDFSPVTKIIVDELEGGI